MAEQPPLPGMPDEPPPSSHRRPRSDVTITKNSGVALCDECCRLIYLHGVQYAPYPRSARWRVVTAHWVKRVCESHKEEFLE